MNTALKLLVVDDEPVVGQSCRRILEPEGFSVETIMNSRDGLTLATEKNYAAILLDIRIPGMDGLEFLEKLREKNTRVPVIMITGYSSIPSAAAAMRLGAVDYIPKPFTPEEITVAIRRLFPQENTKPASKDIPLVSIEKAGAKNFLFFDESWYVPITDELVRAGTFVSPDKCQGVTEVVLPQVGTILYRGLPMAALKGLTSDL